MISRNPLCLVVVSALAGVMFCAGCGNSEGLVSKTAEFRFDNRSVAVIPFKDSHHTYGESRDGMDLAMAVSQRLQATGAAVNVKDADRLAELLKGESARELGWEEVCNRIGVKVLLFGDLQQFTLRDSGVQLIVRGTCRIRLFVYDSDAKRTYTLSPTAVYHPESGAGLPESDMSADKLRGILLGKSARIIAYKFYDHEEKPPTTMPRY